MCIYMYMYVYKYMYINMCISTYTYTHTHIQEGMRTADLRRVPSMGHALLAADMLYWLVTCFTSG